MTHSFPTRRASDLQGQVERLRDGAQPDVVGSGVEAADQRGHAREIRASLAPINGFEPGEMMPLDRGDFLWRERARPLGGHASEAAVALMPPRAPGDLRHFGHGQPALAEIGRPACRERVWPYV